MATNKRKTEKKQNFFSNHYSLSWQYICEINTYIFFILFVFVLAFLIALLYQPDWAVEWIVAFVKELLKKTQNLNMGEMIIFILNNNLRGSFIAMLLGVFLGIYPLVMALFNGYVLGFAANESVKAEGFSILSRLVPHGIFEFPAILLSLAMGTKFGMFIFCKNKKKEFLRRLEQSLRVFLFVILPLLVIAAIIEGFLIILIG